MRPLAERDAPAWRSVAAMNSPTQKIKPTKQALAANVEVLARTDPEPAPGSLAKELLVDREPAPPV